MLPGKRVEKTPKAAWLLRNVVGNRLDQLWLLWMVLFRSVSYICSGAGNRFNLLGKLFSGRVAPEQVGHFDKKYNLRSE
jgi:hypothetical protein